MNTNTKMNTNLITKAYVANNQVAPTDSQQDATHIYRVIDLKSEPANGWKKMKATLCQRDRIFKVSWWISDDDVCVQRGQLVSFEVLNNLEADGDALVVRSVNGASVVNPDLNLIDTLPTSWLPKGSETEDVVAEFRRLWSQLSAQGRAWFNAIFWHQPGRWQQFLTVPASIGHHHANKRGLFTHSVDVATRALRAAQGDPLVNRDVLLLAALLHDLGKADEYLVSKRFNAYQLSERGQLMGHRLTTLEWMAAALPTVASWDRPSEVKVMAVYHAINACYAQDWVGLRAPRTPEAFYLASADTLSGHCELVRKTYKPGSRKGDSHWALRGAAWVMGDAG